MMLVQTRLVKICDKIIYLISNMSNILSKLIICTNFLPLKISLQEDRGCPIIYTSAIKIALKDRLTIIMHFFDPTSFFFFFSH